MKRYEVLVCGTSYPEQHRVNRGDIIAIRPHPWNWGLKEIQKNLVVILDIPQRFQPAPNLAGLTIQQKLRLLKKANFWHIIKHYYPGFQEVTTFAEFVQEFQKTKYTGHRKAMVVAAYDEYLLSRLQEKLEQPILEQTEKPKLIHKRRYNLPFHDLFSSVNLSKVENKSIIYQPFKQASQLVAKFDGQHGNHYLTRDDVDCAPQPEVVIAQSWTKTGSHMVKDLVSDLWITPDEEATPDLSVD